MSVAPAGKRPLEVHLDADGPIHPTAVVDATAMIDPSARVGPFCVVGADVRIGPGTTLQSHVVVHPGTRMGADNSVFPFSVLGADPQDLKYRGEDTLLVIGDGNVIREHATLHRGTGLGGGETRVGSRCLIMVGAHVAHDCVVEDEVILANNVMLGGHCHIEFGATIAGGAGVHHFATVGRMSFVGGLARIAKDVPPFLVVEGSPAEPRKVNTTALARRGYSPTSIESLRSAYKALFRSDDPMEAMIGRLRAEPEQEEAVLALCEFLERMARGVHGRWRETLRSPQGARGRRG